MGVLAGVRSAVRGGARSLKSIGIATLVAGTSLVAVPLVSGLTANAVGSAALDPVQSIDNIPDSGTCGPNGSGRWVKFTAGGSGSSGTLNSGTPKWTGSYTDDTVGDWRSLTVFDVRDENGQVVYFSAVVIGAGSQNPMWQFAGTNSSGQLDVLRFVDNVGSTLVDPAEPNNTNFSQLALCAYPLRVLNILKAVDFNTVAPSASSFPISVSCVPAGGGIPLVFQVVATATTNGTVATVPASVLAPAGATCTATDSVAGWTTTDGVVTMPTASATTITETVTVTNVKIVPQHILSINKTIVGAFAGDQTSFPVTVACTYNGAAIDLTGNGTPLVLNVPPAATVEVRQDAICTATEAVVSSQWTTTPSVMQQTTMSSAQSLTFTNTRRTVQVRATKVVNYAGVTNPGDDLTLFPLMLICSNNGASITFPNAPISSNGSIGPVTAPVGATCSVGEMLAQADVGDWAVTYDPQTTPPLAADATLTVNNTRRSGRISISKTVTPANAPLPAGGFLFNIDCSPGTTYDVSGISVSPGSPNLSGLIPTGMSCLVSEEDPGSAWTPSPAQTIVIAEGAAANPLTFNNVRNSSDLVITKVATGGPITDFTFTVACVGVGYSGPTTRQVVLTPPAVASTTLAGIETGTQCTVTEAAVVGWTLSAITGGTSNLASRSTTLTISTTGNAVTFTNGRDRGSLQISKEIDGGPGGRFTFSVDCPGTESDIAEVEVMVPSGTSAIQPAIPTATGCVVTETSQPANYAPAPPQTVDITRSATLHVTFQNHYVAADVSVTKSDGDVSAVPGTNLVYSMIVKNEDPLGGDTATNVTLSDPLPAGTSFVSVTPSGCTVNAGGTGVNCSLGSLAPQQSVVVTLTVLVNSDRSVGLTNTVNITAGPNDTNPANDTDTETTPILAARSAVDLLIVKSLAAPIGTDNVATWRLVVTNNGPGADSGITIIDALPTSLTLVSAAGSGWSCTASGKTLTCTYSASIAAGETLPTLTLVTQAVGAAGATVTNTATVTGAGLDSNLANNSSTASGVLVAVASAAPSPAAPSPAAPSPAAPIASPLPATGLDGVVPVATGGVLFILGANLLLIARRRRPVR